MPCSNLFQMQIIHSSMAPKHYCSPYSVLIVQHPVAWHKVVVHLSVAIIPKTLPTFSKGYSSCSKTSLSLGRPIISRVPLCLLLVKH